MLIINYDFVNKSSNIKCFKKPKHYSSVDVSLLNVLLRNFNKK